MLSGNDFLGYYDYGEDNYVYDSSNYNYVYDRGGGKISERIDNNYPFHRHQKQKPQLTEKQGVTAPGFSVRVTNIFCFIRAADCTSSNYQKWSFILKKIV